MNYFKLTDKPYTQGDTIHWYDDEQIAQGYANGMFELTDDELKEHLNPTPTPEQLAEQAKSEALQYLLATDHKFYGDYEPKAGEDLEAIKIKRSEARSLLRGGN